MPVNFRVSSLLGFVCKPYLSQLAGHEPLQPRLDALIQAHLEDLAKFESLEERISKLVTTYSSHVSFGRSLLFMFLTFSPR
jgi:hypothetical protein